MVDNSDNITTGEPVTEQAPTADSTAVTTLPTDYIKDGLLDTAPNGKHFIKAAYVGEYAEQIAAVLTPKLTASAFNSAFLRETKKHLRRGTVYEEQKACVFALKLQAIRLVAKHKAPPILSDMINTATGAVYDSTTFEALYKHLDAVYCYMLQQEQNRTAVPSPVNDGPQDAPLKTEIEKGGDT